MRRQIVITMYSNIEYSVLKTPISERDYSVRHKLLLFLQTWNKACVKIRIKVIISLYKNKNKKTKERKKQEKKQNHIDMIKPSV